jgi:pyridoxine 4-dehydrogenase
MDTPTAAASGTFLIGGDLPVHRLGYGTMRLVGDGAWGEPADPAMPPRPPARRRARRHLIDTADAYGPEIAERLIAEAPDGPKALSKGLVIATKGGITRQGPPRPSTWAAPATSSNVSR